MKRIGDILIDNDWIEPSILSRALVKQKETGHRLCSLLVLGGVLSADDAACALGEQHGVAAALQRHLHGRDHSVAPLLSAAIARASVALPIGRMGNGDVIVCVRDPSPALEAQLARAMKEKIRLAVAPAHQLEALVLETYGAAEQDPDANEFDVDLDTGPVMSLELDDEPSDEPLSDEALADLGTLELVDLDDAGVSRDESQAPVRKRDSTLPPTNIVSDAPTFRAATAPVVSTEIIVDAPSQREPPGRAALSAAGIAIPRTQTPQRSGLDAAARPAIARTQTPQRSGLDVAPRPGLDAAPRLGLDVDARPAIARTQTPHRSGLDVAPRPRLDVAPRLGLDVDARPAIARTQTPQRSGLDVAPRPGLDVAPRPGLDVAPRPGLDVAPSPSVARTQTPPRPGLEAAAKSAIQSVADAESAAVAQSIAAAAAAMSELSFDDEPVVGTAPPIEDLPTPEPVKTVSRPVIPVRPITPPAGLPRIDGVRPPPAALAALQRASASATRVPNVPLRPIPALPSRPIPAPTAVVPDGIAVGTQLPSEALAVSPRLAEALEKLTSAPKIDAVCDAVMAFASRRWSAVLLLDIDEQQATGRRGQGAQVSDDVAQWTVMSLEEPSLLRAAFAGHDVATVTPDGHGDVEQRLQLLLARPRAPSAVAICVEGKPYFLLAVGDPDGDDLKTAAVELARLGDGASAALTRLRGR